MGIKYRKKFIPETNSTQLSLLTKLLCYSLLFSPLIFWEPLDYFFDSTKSFFIIGISEILLVCYCWLAYRHAEWRPRISALGIVLFVYISVLIVASLAGVDPFYSFWSGTDRLSGILMWLHLAVIFLVFTSVFRRKEDWHNIFIVSTVVGLLVSGIFVFSLIDPLFHVYTKGGSTLGNSSFLGTFLIFVIFFSLFLAIDGQSYRIRTYGLSTMIIFSFLLFFTKANSAIFAFLGVVLFALALYWVSRKQSKEKFLGFSLLCSLFVLFVIASVQVFETGSIFNRFFLEHTGGARLVLWSLTWDAIRERFWLGWGLENFPMAFFAHYNSCFGSDSCGNEIWFDRAHNKVLDTLIEGGITALVAYIAFMVTPIVLAWRCYLKGRCSVYSLILITTFLAVYFVNNLAGFDTSTSLLFLVVTIGYFSVLLDLSFFGFRRVRLILMTATLVTVVFPFMFYHFFYRPIQTNQMHLVLDAQSTKERLYYYDRMVFGSPIGIDFRRAYLAGLTLQFVFGMNEQERESFAQPMDQEVDLSRRALEETITRSPNYLRGMDLLAGLYIAQGLFRDEQFFQKAEILLDKAIVLNPMNQNPRYTLAAALLAQGRFEEALDSVDGAIQMNQEVGEAWLVKLAALKLIGDLAASDALSLFIVEKFPRLQNETEFILTIAPDRINQLYLYFF